MNYMEYCISPDLTVREAMKKIDRVTPKIVFLIHKNKLIASLTDGDIRRFLQRMRQRRFGFITSGIMWRFRF